MGIAEKWGILSEGTILGPVLYNSFKFNNLNFSASRLLEVVYQRFVGGKIRILSGVRVSFLALADKGIL
tara:strand:+ start:281 stop:487 length:207 start_codon:yes stop_codon:yes gene_type:complete